MLPWTESGEWPSVVSACKASYLSVPSAAEQDPDLQRWYKKRLLTSLGRPVDTSITFFRRQSKQWDLDKHRTDGIAINKHGKRVFHYFHQVALSSISTSKYSSVFEHSCLLWSGWLYRRASSVEANENLSFRAGNDIIGRCELTTNLILEFRRSLLSLTMPCCPRITQWITRTAPSCSTMRQFTTCAEQIWKFAVLRTQTSTGVSTLSLTVVLVANIFH